MNGFDGTRVIGRAYFIGFLWVLGLVAALISVSTISHLILFDFIYGNPNRTHQNIFFMMLILPPLLSIIGIVVAVAVFALPQALQALLMKISVNRFGEPARFSVLLALPAIAVVTWYCFDYFTLHDFNLGINEGADWEPYRHGLTLWRYIGALMAQAPVTLFSFLYVEVAARNRPLKWVVLPALAIIVTAGIFIGYWKTEQQIELQCSQGSLC